MRRKDDAREILRQHGVPLDKNYFTLSSTTVEQVVAAANYYGYRKPKDANGSTARCFYEYANR